MTKYEKIALEADRLVTMEDGKIISDQSRDSNKRNTNILWEKGR